MKFIIYLEKISGVDIYGLVSLLMFVVFFTAMLFWVMRSDKNELDKINHIPLD